MLGAQACVCGCLGVVCVRGSGSHTRGLARAEKWECVNAEGRLLFFLPLTLSLFTHTAFAPLSSHSTPSERARP